MVKPIQEYHWCREQQLLREKLIRVELIRGESMRHRLFLFIFILGISMLFCSEVDTLYFLQTTDVHGHILSYNYKTDKVTDHGLDRIATLIDSFRANHEHVILMETGDLFQGSPLSDYYFHHQSEKQNPIIDVVNALQYDVFTVGNHEIEYGPEIYDALEEACNFPWLAANSIVNDSTTYFKPYEIMEIDGIKVGILGLTTPAIPLWLNKDKYPGIYWEDMLISASKYRDIMRPQVDILVGSFHAGLDWKDGAEQCEKKGVPYENYSAAVGAIVPDFDLIFSGHSHVVFPKKKLTSTHSDVTMYCNSGYHGHYLGVAEVIVEKNNEEVNIVKRTTWNIPVETVEPSAKIVELMQPSHLELKQFLTREIASVDGVITTENAYFEDNIITETINLAQLDYTGADISFACCFNTGLRVENRPFNVRDAYTVYPYENTLYLIELTGNQIKSFLENAARFFVIEDGVITRSKDMAGYNYDMAEGITYQIDPKRAEGERVVNLMLDDTPLDMMATYKVALNSFRFNGGGGLLEHPKDNPIKVISESNEKVRDILINFLAQKNKIELNVDSNWELIR